MKIHFFRRPDYHSDISLFLNDLRSKSADMQAQQAKPMNILCALPNIEQQQALEAGFRAAEVPLLRYPSVLLG